MRDEDVDRQGNVSAATLEVTDTIPATIVLAALSVITVVGFCRVYSGWDFLVPMLVVVLITHIVCFALRLLNVPGYIAIPASVLVLFALVAWKYYPTTLAGPFPTWRTWDFMHTDMQLSRDQFPNAVAPVAAVGGFVVTGAAACGFAAILGDAFAFRAYGRAEAVVPTAVLFIFAAALGVDSHRVALTAAWLVCALILIGLLRAAHDQTEHAWVGSRKRVMVALVPLVAALAVVAAVGGAIIGPAVPGAHADPLIHTNKRHDVTEVLSPLVDIRSRLINLSKIELFTVATTEPHYWRATGLPRFDGTTWGLPDRNLTEVSGDFAAPTPYSRPVSQEIRITGLSGKLLPAAYSPNEIDNGSAYWVDDTGTLVLPGGLKRGNTFEIVSSVADVNPDILRAATSNKAPGGSAAVALPHNFPGDITETAKQVTAGATTVYDKARALQDWFQTNFQYDLSVQRGHSNNAILNFLRVKRGYCEQFAGAYAAMARSLGIPARVAVGFTPGELRSDGKYHVYGRNAHAWPEVWFDNIGWISFEPTPGRGEPGTQSYTGLQPAQAAALGDGDQSTPVSTASTAPTTTIPGEDVPTTTARAGAGVATTLPAQTPPTSKSGGGISPWAIGFALVLAAIAGWLLLMPRVVQAMHERRLGHSPTDRIEHSWRRAASSLALVGMEVKTGETPVEHAQRIERKSGIDRRTLRDLAGAATAAIYGGVGDERAADHSHALASEVIASVRRRMTLSQKLAVMFDPRRADLLVTR